MRLITAMTGTVLLLTTAAFASGEISLPRPPVPQVIEAPRIDPVFSLAISTSNAARLIAKAYGVDHANEIEAMSFSFNVQSGDTLVRREWYWDVAESRIEYHGEGPTGLPISLTYHRDNLDKGDAALNRRIDAQFVDDQYWLLFPFHLAWEKDLRVADQPSRQMYIEPRESECVSIRYPVDSPEHGDVYEVFIGPDKLIREWAYRPKNSEEPSFVTTWERHAKAGPLLFSLMHRSNDGEYRLWYDRISVKLVNEGWVDAEPLENLLSQSEGSQTASKNPL